MKNLLLIISLLATVMTNAQESHIVLQKGNGTNFIPTSLRDKGDAALHIYSGKTIDLYDNEISFMRSIEADSIQIEYLASTRREREVTGVECDAIIKVEELTEVYRNYIPNFDEMTRSEKIEAIIKHEENYSGTRSTSSILVTEPQEGITLFCNREYSNNFFAYHYFGEKYPKTGIMLDEEEKVFRFNAIYQFTYTEWGDYKEEYDTLSNKGVLQARYIDTDDNNSTGSAFYITQTLFDQDDRYEYIRPVYIAVDGDDAPISAYPSYSETPETSESKYFEKILASAGIEIVKDNGEVLSSVAFGDNYEMIGDLTTLSGYVVKTGTDITILKMGEYRYMTFDTAKEEEEGFCIYKHFYKIDNITNSIKQVKEPTLIKVVPAVPEKNNAFQVEVDSNSGGKIIINSAQGTQKQQESIAPGRNIVNIEATEQSGTYIVTQIESGVVTATKKIFIK